MKRLSALLLAFAAGCAPQTPAPSPAPAPAAGEPGVEAGDEPRAGTYAPPTVANAPLRHREVHWVRTAAEYRALTEQIFDAASEAVGEHGEGRERGSWGVIMDADETVLDNSEYQRRIAEAGQEFDPEGWTEWVKEEAADVVPGADRFIRRVQELGGRVAIVTNRSQEECPATRRNLESLGMRVAVVLCESDTGEKEPRFRMVRNGTAAEALPPLEVVMWVGDNIGDFPHLDQGLRDAPADAFRLFGDRYFVLPNPMYGSWMGNDWR